MIHIYNLSDAALEQPSIVTIGVFDGVHRGHQHLLAPLVAEAHATGRLAVVLTLFPHPDVVLRGLTGRHYLTTSEQKARLLGELGGDVEQAADWLGPPYGVEGIVVHGDHRGREFGFPTENMDIGSEQFLPANGIYACWALLGNERFMAVTSLGIRPQFGGDTVFVEP